MSLGAFHEGRVAVGGERAAVRELPRALDREARSGNQRAGALQVTALRTTQIDLRHEYLLRRAVGQRHHLGGQERHLFGRERHTGRELVLLGERHAGVHEGRVFRFRVAVAGEIAPAGQYEDRVINQLLFVEAVAQALEARSGQEARVQETSPTFLSPARRRDRNIADAD